MIRKPTYNEFPAPWAYLGRKLNEQKVTDVYNAVARGDSHGAAFYAATVEGRKLGLNDSAIRLLIEGSA